MVLRNFWQPYSNSIIGRSGAIFNQLGYVAEIPDTEFMSPIPSMNTNKRDGTLLMRIYLD